MLETLLEACYGLRKEAEDQALSCSSCSGTAALLKWDFTFSLFNSRLF